MKLRILVCFFAATLAASAAAKLRKRLEKLIKNTRGKKRFAAMQAFHIRKKASELMALLRPSLDKEANFPNSRSRAV